MIRTGIVCGDSPSAGSLIRMLINHPEVEIAWVEAPDSEGRLLSRVHTGLFGETYMRFCREGDLNDVDVLFLCHNSEGDSERYLRDHPMPESVKVIDLSPDFRTVPEDSKWLYALPELNRRPMVHGTLFASIPGAYASIVLLSLLPLAKARLLKSPVHVMAVGPSTDSIMPGETYALLDHEEVDEIRHALKQLQPDFEAPILFTAMAGGWRHGIAVTIHLATPESDEHLKDLYYNFYEDHSFTYVTFASPDLREVVGTNKCLVCVQKIDDELVITAVLDESMKGSASAAIQAMNLLFGLQERVGLMLKTSE